MPLLGSSAKSTTNQSTTSTANYNTGSAPAANFNLSGLSTGKKGAIDVSISTSDYGAIDQGAKLAREALNFAGEANSRAIQAVQSTSSSAIDKTLSLANKNQVSEGSQLQTNLLYAVVVGAAAWVLIKVAK